jgi:hypothetical protein
METKYIYKVADVDFCSSIAEVQINNRVLQVPFYGSIIRTSQDYQALRDAVNSGKLKNTAAVVYTLGDAHKFKVSAERTIFEFTGEKVDYRLLSEFIIAIDPIAEYWVSENQSENDKLLRIPDLPKALREIFEAKGKERKRKIEAVFKEQNEAALSGIVEWYLKKAISLGSELGIPPCIPIKGQKSLEYSTVLNRIAVTIQEDNGWQKAVYLLLDFAAFKRPEIIAGVLKMLATLRPNIIAIKIRNPAFEKAEASAERVTLQSFLEGLRTYKDQTKALSFVINADSIGYVYLALGIDGFIEPVDGNFNPDIRVRRAPVDLDAGEIPKKTHHGKYADMQRLDEQPYENVRVMFKNNGNVLSCHCFECNKYNGQGLPTEEYEWNSFRRRHRLHARDEHVSQIKESIRQKNLRGAMFDRVSESSKLSAFKSFFS